MDTERSQPAAQTAATIPVIGIPLPRMFESLRYRDYRYLWTTSFLSASARTLQQISLGWLAFDLTGSGALLGIVLFIYQVPFLTFSLLVGVLTDRVDRKKLLAMSQFTMAAFAVALAVDVALGWVEPWHLFVFAFISGTENTIIHIVRQALVPRVVPRESLLNAVSLNTTGFNVARIAAPGVGGVLIVAIGVAGNFGIQALLLVGVALASLPMRIGVAEGAEQRRGGGGKAVLGDMAEALRYIASRRLLTTLVLVQYVTLFFALPYVTFLPVWTAEVLDTDAGVLGLLYVVTGLGALLGTLTLAHAGNVRRKGLLLIVSVGASAAGLVGLSAVSGLYPTIAMLAFLGAVQVIFFSINITAVQSVVPDGLQGRVMSIFNLGHGAQALGTLAMGYLVEAFGVQQAMALMGAPLLALTLLAALTLGAVRRM